MYKPQWREKLCESPKDIPDLCDVCAKQETANKVIKYLNKFYTGTLLINNGYKEK